MTKRKHTSEQCNLLGASDCTRIIVAHDNSVEDQNQLAWHIVKQAFKDKVDKGGMPYIGHMQRMTDMLINRFNVNENDDIICVAILHDLLEDCPEWTEKSLRLLFSDSVVDAVVCLTRNASVSYEQYIDEVNNNDIAAKVKIADLIDNMDVTRLNELTDNDIRRLKKYWKAYQFLNS